MKEYKVLSQRDNWFSSNFDAPTIEKVLNQLAGEGWGVVTITTVEAVSWTGKREEVLIFLEREKE